MHITLPDGGVRSYERPVSGAELAQDISLSLAKAAVAVRMDGEMKDLATVIDQDAGVAIVTAKDPEALELIRHDAAHVLAQAVQELFPGTQVTIGPAIENGFYYDFARDEPFTPDDLPKIEARMREIVDRDEPIIREVWDRAEAIDHFESIGEHYKAEIIAGIPAGEAISIYRQGDWLDLCRGPHLPSTGKLPKAFKLTKLAGAYWRGDSRNAMLQRIYGTAWARPEGARSLSHPARGGGEARPPQARPRDGSLPHAGRGGGLGVLAPEGLDALPHARELHAGAAGGGRLRRGAARRSSRPRRSGRSRATGRSSASTCSSCESEDKVLGLKPMNCPGHVQIFKQGMKSYRDLPLRMAEFGSCHRYEPSGALHGLMRVRAFTQDDAHIFCTEEQITSETLALLRPAARRSTATSASPTSREVCRPAREARRLRRDLGQGRRRAARRPRRRPASRPASIRAKARSTDRSWSSSCATPSAATGSAARCRSTSCCRSGSTPATSARTARSTGR